MFFRFVFSTAARLIKLPQVTAPGEILPFLLILIKIKFIQTIFQLIRVSFDFNSIGKWFE